MSGKQSLLHFHRHPYPWRRWVAAMCVLLALAGCDRPRTGRTTAEGDEPDFRRGMKLLSTNKPAALEAFQKAIDKRGGDAPESHFESGRIYLDHFKDHVAAIYHFRRYLALRPNGNYTTQVGQLIETAKKEYIRELAGNPLEAQADRLDLIDQRDKLQAEVVSLRAELERLARNGRGMAAVANNTLPPSAPTRPGAAAAVPSAPNVAPAPTPTTGWANAVPENSPAPEVTPVLPEIATNNAGLGASQPVGSGRTYVVQKGDNLLAISRTVYGSASHWRAIYEANRDRVLDPNVLKAGTVLRLP